MRGSVAKKLRKYTAQGMKELAKEVKQDWTDYDKYIKSQPLRLRLRYALMVIFRW